MALRFTFQLPAPTTGTNSRVVHYTIDGTPAVDTIAAAAVSYELDANYDQDITLYVVDLDVSSVVLATSDTVITRAPAVRAVQVVGVQEL